jgi:hypothetical protein
MQPDAGCAANTEPGQYRISKLVSQNQLDQMRGDGYILEDAARHNYNRAAGGAYRLVLRGARGGFFGDKSEEISRVFARFN